jgi:hypothetical protein
VPGVIAYIKNQKRRHIEESFAAEWKEITDRATTDLAPEIESPA